MSFNILYQRNTNGSVQQWQIEVIGNKYRSISGKVGGKLLISEFTVAEPKNVGRANETSAEEQSQMEAAAKFKKKLESGYSETLDGIDNTGLLEPMLAKEWKNYSSKVKWPVISSEKLDGVRANATSMGLVSRNGKPFISVPHIHEALKPFYDKYPEYVFDGEMYNPTFKDRFDAIISMVRKSKPTAEDLKESAKHVQFWVFDIFRKDGKEVLPAIKRKELIATICGELFPNSSIIKPLEFDICHNQEELDEKYGRYLEEGTEGQMINAFDALYSHSRTACLLKRKEFLDAEFKILGVVSGKGNRDGCGKLILEVGSGTCDCSLKGSVDYMKEVLENKNSYIGKLATVKFQGYTKDGSLRFPVCISIGRNDYE